MLKKSKNSIILMLGIMAIMVSSLTAAHIFTASATFDKGQTHQNWNGSIYFSYDGYTSQLNIDPQIIPGPNGEVPSNNSWSYYYRIIQGTATQMGTFNASINTPFSTNMADMASIQDGNMSMQISVGGTGFQSPFGILNPKTVQLNATNSPKPTMNTKIVGNNVTVDDNLENYKFDIKLIDNENNPLNNYSINFVIDGQIYTTFTDTKGQAFVNLNNFKDDININVNFNGLDTIDLKYMPSDNNFTVHVNHINQNSDSSNSSDNPVTNTAIPIIMAVLAIVCVCALYRKN